MTMSQTYRRYSELSTQEKEELHYTIKDYFMQGMPPKSIIYKLRITRHLYLQVLRGVIAADEQHPDGWLDKVRHHRKRYVGKKRKISSKPYTDMRGDSYLNGLTDSIFNDICPYVQQLIDKKKGSNRNEI